MVRSKSVSTLSTLLLLATLVVACSDEQTATPPADSGEAGVADAGRDLPPPDVTPLDTATDTVPPEDQAPDSILCRYCLDNIDCGAGLQNLCLQLPSGESVCGLDCSADEELCPEGFFCANVEGEAMQCVPETLFCENQCGDPPTECETEGEICDPLTGHCGPPLELCDECVVDVQCGEGNMCLTFPDVDNSRACGRSCSNDNPCPDTYLCATVDELGTIQQCVPQALTCIDRCSTVICEEEGYGCNPLNGLCEPPLAFCDECMASSQCGDTLDLCVALADESVYCLQDCSVDSLSCPVGTVCIPVGIFQQCVPIEMTCVNHCLEPEVIECTPDENCDPITGVCHASLVGLCGRPCENNYDCGGQKDLCIRFADDLTGGAFCARDCSDTDPCPLGYDCRFLSDNVTQQCVPGGFDPNCSLCADSDCPEGEFCRPSDGVCFPEPTPCVEQSECAPGEICSTWDNRCEPIGLPCTYGMYDCSWDMDCSATSFEETGVCLQSCYAIAGEMCPSTAPVCESFHRAYSACVERGLGRAERCARLMDWSESVGKPCPDDETETGCSVAAPTCLDDIVGRVPGFCTITCDPDEEAVPPCPAGSTCHQVIDTSGLTTESSVVQYCIPSVCECLMWPDLEVGEADIMQDALDEMGLSRCDLSFSFIERETAGATVASNAYQVELAGLVRNEGLYGANVVRDQLQVIDADVTLAEAIDLAATNLGYGTDYASPALGDPSFCAAIQNLFEAADPLRPTCDTLDPLGEQLPTPALRAQVGRLIAAAGWAAKQRNGLLAGALEEDFDGLIDTLHGLMLLNSDGAPDLTPSTVDVLNFKYDAIYGVAAELARVVETADLDLGEEDVSAVDIQVDTPYGLIVLRGSGEDTYCPSAEGCDTGTVLDSHVLLLIDLGGDDEYRGVAGATTGFAEAVSILIDLEGNDLYTYTGAGIGDGADGDGRSDGVEPVSLSNIGRQGSSRGGIAFAFDWGQGEDLYESLRMSQGFGLLGVGALVDDGCTGEAGCTDSFTVEAAGQGVGLFGIGVLLLGDGGSELTGYHLVQGAGGPLGAGVVINIAGDDSYVAVPGEDADVLYPAPGRLDRVVPGGSNWSAAQGAAIGRADFPSPGGEHVSGGVGLLVDLAGDDEYSAGIVAQGAGYWHGLGILVDSAGADQYDCNGFSQGSGLDFGAGVLAEQDGDDIYNEIDSNDKGVLGSGESFGMGIVFEELGDDTYRAGPQSLGMGFFNGAGIFIDNHGNDAYANVVSERTMGKATRPEPGLGQERRVNARTIGLFVDANGVDTYPAGERGPDSNTNWTQITAGEPRYEWGVGADGDGASGVTTLAP